MQDIPSIGHDVTDRNQADQMRLCKIQGTYLAGSTLHVHPASTDGPAGVVKAISVRDGVCVSDALVAFPYHGGRSTIVELILVYRVLIVISRVLLPLVA